MRLHRDASQCVERGAAWLHHGESTFSLFDLRFDLCEYRHEAPSPIAKCLWNALRPLPKRGPGAPGRHRGLGGADTLMNLGMGISRW